MTTELVAVDCSAHGPFFMEDPNSSCPMCQTEEHTWAVLLNQDPPPVPVLAWESDIVQHTRLLAEIYAMGLEPWQRTHLRQVMCVSDPELEELFARADESWEGITAAL